MRCSGYTYLFYLFITLLLAGTIMNCTPTRRLKKNDYLLYSQQVKGNKRVSSDELISYCKQKPNRRLPILQIMPYLHAYYVGKKQYDKKWEVWQKELDSAKTAYQREMVALNNQMRTLLQSPLRKQDYKAFKKDSTKLARKIDRFRQKGNEKIEKMTLRLEEGNWLMRSVGEPPAIYDQTSALHAASQMQKYLIKKGFFKSEVTLKEDTVGKKINLTYQVKETEPYLIRLFEYEISDSLVLDIVFKERKKSFIQEKTYYDETNLENERKRITNILRNNGYFDFNSNYILFEVDSTVGNRCLDVTMIVKNPPMEPAHRRYFMKEIVFLSDVDMNKPQKRDTTFYKGVTYVQASNRYSKRVLDSKIFLKPSQLYDLSKVDNTQSALTGTDMFKFVNINFERIGEDSLQMNLFSSDNDKYQYTFESGLAVTQSIPGPFASLSWKNRNLFRSADVFEIAARISFDAQGNVTNINNRYSSQEYGLNTSLTFPRVLLPLPTTVKKHLAMLNPRTRFNLGYTLIQRPEFNRGGLQGGVNIQWNNPHNELFNLGITDLTILHSKITPAYDSIIDAIDKGRGTYRRVFNNSIVSNINFTYTKATTNYGANNQINKFFRLYVELAGISSALFKETLLNNQGKIYGLSYYKYFKLSGDYRIGVPLSKNNQVASRLHLGVIRPYGGINEGLPYEKFFFSGGSNSNRAWRPRRIGAGSYTPPRLESGEFDYSFEQPGELILESSVEWRTKLFSFFNWAFFIDASNVWMLPGSPDPLNREGSTFKPTEFWKELAIGAGFGLRMDFTFLILRFDVGMKMYDPAQPLQERFIGGKIWQHPPFGKKGQAQLNIGIGYPF